jgi:hypothetical protein
MAIYMTAQWKCRPGSEAKVEEALRRFVAAVGENEPETRVYTALRQAADATSFMTYFIAAGRQKPLRPCPLASQR